MPRIRGQSNTGEVGAGESPGQAVAGRGRGGSSFAARFGKVILQHGIAAIPSALLHYQAQLALSAQQVWLVSYILSHKWDEDLPYPSLKKMARSTTLSLSQLQRIKNSLCEMGYLQVYPRYGEKQRQETNAYDFSGLFDRLEELILQDPATPNSIRAEGAAPASLEISEWDPSFAARYGRVISRRGVAAVPRAIFTHQAALKLTPQQVWFVTYIFSFQWDTALPYPSIRKMAAQTGYSTVQLHNIKSELVEAGYLRLVRRSTEEGGQDTNAYDFSGLLDAIRRHLHPDPPAPSTDVPPRNIERPQPTIRRRGRRSNLSVEGSTELSRGDSREFTVEDSAQLSDEGSMQFAYWGRAQLSGGGSAYLSSRDRGQLAGEGGTQLPAPAKRKEPVGAAHAYQGGIARGTHEIEASGIESKKKKDSTHSSPKSNVENRKDEDSGVPPYSPYIAAVISDFSDDLSDSAHVISNVTQALRLWQQSRLDEQGFTELLYEAKRRTRSAQGRQGHAGMGNKMAYFFTVLRELCREL